MVGGSLAAARQARGTLVVAMQKSPQIHAGSWEQSLIEVVEP